MVSTNRILVWSYEKLKSNKADSYRERQFRKQVLGEIISYSNYKFYPL